jgi:hypothetical protein
MVVPFGEKLSFGMKYPKAVAGWLSGLGIFLTVALAQAGNSPVEFGSSVATNLAARGVRNGGGERLFACFRQRYESRVERMSSVALRGSTGNTWPMGQSLYCDSCSTGNNLD